MAALFEASGPHGGVLGLHDDHAISALFLGAVQSLIGQLDQSLESPIGGGQHECRTDAYGKAAGNFRSLMRNVEFGNGTLDARQHFGDVLPARLVQHDRKLLAAVARDEVQGTTRTLRSEERRVGKECRSRWSP